MVFIVKYQNLRCQLTKLREFKDHLLLNRPDILCVLAQWLWYWSWICGSEQYTVAIVKCWRCVLQCVKNELSASLIPEYHMSLFKVSRKKYFLSVVFIYLLVVTWSTQALLPNKTLSHQYIWEKWIRYVMMTLILLQIRILLNPDTLP